MLSVKPLRLKRETYRLVPTADTHNVAHVWVDSGISHLDGLYSYRIPNVLIGYIQIGSRIKVPFNGQSCEALVVDISISPDLLSNLKIIEALLGPIPVANPQMINFYLKMSQYWASDPYSLIKAGIPARVASVEKKFESIKISPTKPRSRKKFEKTFLMHSPNASAYVELATLALSQMQKGSTLLLLPDVKDVSRVHKVLNHTAPGLKIFRLDSSLTRSQRYENFLSVATSEEVLVIGTRSALFAPIKDLNSIIVGFEKSEQYYEQKHPYWNTRDSAFLRAEIESTDIFFTGYVPSTEMAYQIENRNVKFNSVKSSLQTLAFPQDKGELLPGGIIPVLRKSLVEGRILFLAPRKGYANALLCSQCKNLALCVCGGRLFMSSQVADPVCVICSTTTKDWSCKWCRGTRKYASARGIERFYEEIGRAFPNTAIQLSSAPNILEDLLASTKIVIATTGSIPDGPDDYSCVVILEGQRFLASGSSTYEEIVYESFFEAASRVRKNGKVLVVLDSFHPVVSGLTRWNPSVLVKKILRENEEAFLPPFTATAVITVSKAEGSAIKNGFLKSLSDGRLPESSKVYISENVSKNEARILVSVPRQNRGDLAEFLRELSRKRAISKKSFIKIALDPFDLLA
jgi:primosomal protein N' (replication factor Y)